MEPLTRSMALAHNEILQCFLSVNVRREGCGFGQMVSIYLTSVLICVEFQNEMRITFLTASLKRQVRKVLEKIS